MKNLLLFAIGLTLFTITCAGQESPFVRHEPVDEGPIVIEIEDSPEATPKEKEKGDLINWAGEYDANSIEKAYIDGKLIMLYYYTTDSKWCEEQRKVFMDPAVASVINKHFLSFKMDVRNIPPAGRVELDVSSVPVIYFLFPQAKKEDTLVKIFSGFQNREEMMEKATIALMLKELKDAQNKGN